MSTLSPDEIARRRLAFFRFLDTLREEAPPAAPVKTMRVLRCPGERLPGRSPVGDNDR